MWSIRGSLRSCFVSNAVVFSIWGHEDPLQVCTYLMNLSTFLLWKHSLRNQCKELTFLPLSTSFLCIIPRFWEQFTRTTEHGSIGNSSGNHGYKSQQFCVTLSWFVNKSVSRSPFSENQCFIFTRLLLSDLRYNSTCSMHRWKDISSELQTKNE